MTVTTRTAGNGNPARRDSTTRTPAATGNVGKNR